MMFNKIRKFYNYWKEVILISVVCLTFFFIHDYFWPYGDDNTLDPEPKTGAEVMADRWSHPEPNDPNFLADFRQFIGYEWSEQ